MDVALLAGMIAELIADHDLVGLPGMGTFVAEVVPATFSDKGYTINPPYRRLSFHPSRTEDSLLTDFYAASNGITKEAASAYLTQFLQELKTVLKERKTIVLPGLGRLRATVENNFFFVPDADLDIFPDGFALKPLSLKTIQDNAEPLEIRIRQVAGPEPELESELEPEPELEKDLELKPAAETAAKTVELKPEQVEILEQEEMQAEGDVPAGTESRGRFRWWIPLLVLLVVVAAVALLAFIIVARVAPDLIDTILYTPEELRIINY